MSFFGEDSPDYEAEFSQGLMGLQNSFKSRVRQLQQETARVQKADREKELKIDSLERRVAELENALSDYDRRYQKLQEDKNLLLSENSQLISGQHKLKQEVQKLTNFKSAIMQTFKDEDNSGSFHSSPVRPPPGMDHGVSRATTSAGLNTADLQDIETFIRRSPARPRSPSPSRGSGRSPVRPRSPSSPRRSFAESSIRPSSTMRMSNGNDGAFDLIAEIDKSVSARPSSPPRSPSRGRSDDVAAMDGKEFFRQARARISYEDFNALLEAIKKLNAQEHSREDTVNRAWQIFGPANEDLFGVFKKLLGRHL